MRFVSPIKQVKICCNLFATAMALLLSGITLLHPPLQGEPIRANGSPNVVDISDASPTDWPQLGHDAQRTNYSPQHVKPPYCYAWKWYGVPMASRAQPVVVNNRLFIGGMDGVMYARDATTGAELWRVRTDGPIRHSAGVLGSAVIFSSHDGFTYALDVANGAQFWKVKTGPSVTAPLIDELRGRVFIASTSGELMALRGSDGLVQWTFDAGAPILTSPSLSIDGSRVYLGSEAIEAIAVDASTGALVWRTRLQGQSLSERYPVVAGDTVIYRSQPLYFFHTLLREGDSIMDSAGPRDPDWAVDWAKVRPKIVGYLTAQPSKQTFFALDGGTGAVRGIAPVLYTYGNNDLPNVPVVRGSEIYVTYRARHGIQTDGGAVHVSSKYDAELGRMDLAKLDIAGLRQADFPKYNAEFRMTSDEPAMLTMGGDILFVDNWERLGGVNVRTGQLVHVGNVSNVWPECYSGDTCGPGGSNPFFPLLESKPAYPFPWPRVTDGVSRSGVVIANNMLYWRVIEGGLAGIKSGTCDAPKVWQSPAPSVMSTDIAGDAQVGAMDANRNLRVMLPIVSTSIPVTKYIDTDLTTPPSKPSPDLVERLRREVRAMLQLANGQHLLPVYIERGFSSPRAWPYNASNCEGNAFCVTQIGFGANGNVFWFDPGELLLTMAQAYPYLDAQLQADARTYMAAEMKRYPPLTDLPYGGTWLTEGVARERYQVPFRDRLNNWPPAAANINAIYALWLWSKNAGDWTYACANWSQARALFYARKDNIRFYSDIAGLIGYVRLAKALRAQACAGVTEADVSVGTTAAVNAMNASRGATQFAAYARFAENAYLDPRDIPTGYSLPVFFGMTPEVGRFLREQTNGAALGYLNSKQTGDGVLWWYLTRVGVHAEDGETSFLLPWTGWSHFLARAYVAGDSQADLRKRLDWPWTTGDLYSIQKIVAAIHAN